MSAWANPEKVLSICLLFFLELLNSILIRYNLSAGRRVASHEVQWKSNGCFESFESCLVESFMRFYGLESTKHVLTLTAHGYLNSFLFRGDIVVASSKNVCRRWLDHLPLFGHLKFAHLMLVLLVNRLPRVLFLNFILHEVITWLFYELMALQFLETLSVMRSLSQQIFQVGVNVTKNAEHKVAISSVIL